MNAEIFNLAGLVICSQDTKFNAAYVFAHA